MSDQVFQQRMVVRLRAVSCTDGVSLGLTQYTVATLRSSNCNYWGTRTKILRAMGRQALCHGWSGIDLGNGRNNTDEQTRTDALVYWIALFR